MHNASTLAMSFKRTMHRVHFNIVSVFILASLIFFASCSKELKAPEPLPLETGVLSASKNEVVLDAAYNPDMEAVTFSLATDRNSLIKYTLILTSGDKSDSIAITQNTVSKLFTNSDLNAILLDKFGLAIGVAADLTAQVKASIPINGKTAASNIVTIKVTPSDTAPNLVQGGKFNAGDESKWTVLNISSGVTVSFIGGKAVWTGGSWGHAGIYQAINVEANKKYQISMNVSGSGASDTWFEIYAGKVVPQQGQDYNDGGMRLGLNTWIGCGGTAFDGPLTSLSCNGTGGGVIEFPTAGTVYLVIRGGGANLGTTGISVDNVELRPLETPNLVQGGKFDAGDESKWTVLNISAGVSVSFTGGKAVWTGGSWGHAGIYQAIDVEANKKYQISMNVSGSGASDTWFEIYAGKVVPQQGQDYTDGGMRLGLNTWNGCGKTGFDGPLTTLSCNGTGGGVVEFPAAGTVYLVIRGGGADLGTTGISVDNVELRPL